MIGGDRLRGLIEIGYALVILFVGSLAFNAASDHERWPGCLDLIRRFPWATLLGLLLIAVVEGVVRRARRSVTAGARVVFALPPRLPHFVGRDEVLNTLHALMIRRSASTVRTLFGIPGVGKTQLAVEFAHRHLRKYRLVAFLNAAHPEQLYGQFAALATTLELGGEHDGTVTVALVHRELERRGRWLLIFDNAEDPGDLLRFLPPMPGDIVVTSRRAGWESRGDVVDVDVFSRTESADLLSSRIPGISPDVADGIADILGDLPLALEQAASYVGLSEPSPRTYLGNLRKDIGPLLDRGSVADRPGVTMASLWSMYAHRLAESDPAALDLMRFCAVMAPEPIPITFLTAPVESAEGPPVDGPVLETVVRLGLVRRNRDTIVMHRLVQASVRNDMTSQQRIAANDKAIRLLSDRLPTRIHRTPEDWAPWAEMLPHALAVMDHASTADAEQLSLTARSGLYLQQMGDEVHALALMRRAVRRAQELYGPDDATVGEYLNNLGDAVREFGDPKAARPLLERALAIAEEADQPDDRIIAVRLSNLALAVRRLGDVDLARALLERAVPLAEQAFGESHPETGIRLGALGLVHRDQGRLDVARSLMERALRIAVDSHGPRHPRVAIRLSHLGQVLYQAGDHDEARRMLQRSVDISEAAYGADHPRTRAKRRQLDKMAG